LFVSSLALVVGISDVEKFLGTTEVFIADMRLVVTPAPATIHVSISATGTISF
jgi:hypothetical protein